MRDNHDRIASLDGLRGLAVLMVFLLHTVLLPEQGYGLLKQVLEFGHLGVDLFFVLSGFLITGILFASKENSHYFRNFYARRAVRIFPLYYLYLAVYYFAVVHFRWVNFGADKTSEAARDLHWAWFYATNLEIARTGAFVTASLNQSWTLAVEEHFYLVWPFLVFYLRRRGILLSTVLIAAGSLALRTAMEARGVSAYTIFTFTLCRIDAFAIGGAMSVMLTDSEWRRKLAVWTGPGTVVFGVLILLSFYVVSTTLFTAVGYTVAACFFTCAIGYLVLHRESRSSRIVSAKWLRRLGKYSYAIYIFHFPVLIFVSRKLPLTKLMAYTHSALLASAIVVGLVGALSGIAAWLSWHLYEKRFIALKRFFPEANLRRAEEYSGATPAA